MTTCESSSNLSLKSSNRVPLPWMDALAVVPTLQCTFAGGVSLWCGHVLPQFFRSCLICQSRTFLKLRQGSCGSFLVSRVLSNRCSHNFLLSAACKICFQTPVISCIDEHLYRAATFNSRCPMCSPACTTTAHPMDTTLSSTRCGPWCGDGDDRFVGNLPRAPHESRDFQ